MVFRNDAEFAAGSNSDFGFGTRGARRTFNSMGLVSDSNAQRKAVLR